MQNKVTILSNAKSLAFSSGDLDRMNAIENDLLNTQNTLSQLQMLLDATRAANVSSLDLSTVVTAGVQAAQNTSAIPANPTAVLSDYDISTYAADPAYLQKITDMLTYMPNMDIPAQVDSYIDREVVGSPLTGAMVIEATNKYAVDTRLTMAIMELDSRFGTAGTGASTFNPGNVGNTGSSITTYASWADGVAAVAYWLSKHRSGVPTPVTVVPDTNIPTVVLPVTDPSTTATSTPPVVQPVVVPPVVPVTVVATSTSPVAVTVTSTSTNAIGTTTITTTTASSSNPTSTSTQTFNLNDSNATSTNATSTLVVPPFNATTTNPVSTTTPTDIGSTTSATSTNATSTNVNISNATSTAATSTQPVPDLGNIGAFNSTSTNATSSDVVIPTDTSSSTPSTASTTQARKITVRKVV